MKNLFVPYHIAQAAKLHGFDELCIGVYTKNSKQKIHFSSEGYQNSRLQKVNKDYYITAPTYQQLADWFRTKHHLEITVHTECSTNEVLGYHAMLYGIMSWPVFRMRVETDEFDYYATWNEAFINAFATLKKP